MTAITDRATVSLALECASRITRPAGDALDNALVLSDMLDKAAAILAWHDKQCAERAKRDSVRANAPKLELHPGFAGA